MQFTATFGFDFSTDFFKLVKDFALKRIVLNTGGCSENVIKTDASQ